MRRWQLFLAGQGLDTPVDGHFGGDTERSTLAFQARHGLRQDGLVGNQSYGQAGLLGFALVEPSSRPEAGFPARPAFKPLSGTGPRRRAFGSFRYEAQPLKNNRENIRILDDWEERNIVTVPVPELKGVAGAGRSPAARVHRLVAPQFQALWAAWRGAGLLPLVLSWQGAFAPRFVRGSTRTLSNHAFGSAFDINGRHNAYGAEPAWRGEEGSVFELVPIAQQHGFYWGGHFAQRRDGMHFEFARLQ